MMRNIKKFLKIDQPSISEDNFLDFPAAKKKQILKTAVQGSNQQQIELEKKYYAQIER